MRILSRSTDSEDSAFSSSSSSHKSDATAPIVSTAFGQLRGRRIQIDSAAFDVFLGVPFARAPVGELRFCKPEAPLPWSGVRSATRFSARAVQTDPILESTTLSKCSEDSLYLNIVAPTKKRADGYPVLFYIHGGAFLVDSAVKLSPHALARSIASHGIVVVTVHYRLGYLGFFCTDDAACPSNLGLWDQYAALKWTRENVHAFGGDPNAITVAGQSAGAVSAHALSVSPYTRDWIHRRMLLGGSLYTTWGCQNASEVAAHCRQYAFRLGWKGVKGGARTSLQENRAMIEYLRTLPASKLGGKLFFTDYIEQLGRLPLGPVVDGDFLPYSLDRLRRESPVRDTLVGGGEYESLLFIAFRLMQANEKFLSSMTQHADRMYPGREDVSRRLSNLYGVEKTESRRETTRRVAEGLSDLMVAHAVHCYSAERTALGERVLCYNFRHGSRSGYGLFGQIMPFIAGTHTSEVLSWFGVNYYASPLPLGPADRRVQRQTQHAFAQFIKHGTVAVDGVEWTPASAEKPDRSILFVGKGVRMVDDAFDGRMRKLDDVVGTPAGHCGRDKEKGSVDLDEQNGERWAMTARAIEMLRL